MEQIQNKLRPSVRDVKWVRPQNFHLTLKFLGEVEAAQLAGVQAVLGGVVGRHRPFQVDLLGVGAFPCAGKARVLWVGVQGDLSPLKSMARQMDRDFRELGIEADGKPFSGHLTLGRLKRPVRNPVLARAIDSFSGARVGHLEVSQIGLFSSQLSRTGPTYTCVSRHALHEDAA